MKQSEIYLSYSITCRTKVLLPVIAKVSGERP